MASPYQSGRGFMRGSGALNYNTTLGDLAAMNSADMGFTDFYKDRRELGAGNEFDYDWRTIARPGIKKGQGPLGAPNIPSPLRGVQKLAAATTPGMTNTQYKRWNKQVGQDMTWGGHQRDPYTGNAMVKTDEESGVNRLVAGHESAPDYTESGRQQRMAAAASARISRRTSIPRVPGMATGGVDPLLATDPRGMPDPFATAVTPMSDEESTRQGLNNLAGNIEGFAPGAVGRGVAQGVRKIGSGNVSTVPGAIGTVLGSTARSVGSAAVGKIGEAVKSRWAGAKQPGSQFPEPPPDPFA